MISTSFSFYHYVAGQKFIIRRSIVELLIDVGEDIIQLIRSVVVRSSSEREVCICQHLSNLEVPDLMYKEDKEELDDVDGTDAVLAKVSLTGSLVQLTKAIGTPAARMGILFICIIIYS